MIEKGVFDSLAIIGNAQRGQEYQEHVWATINMHKAQDHAQCTPHTVHSPSVHC